MRLLCGYETLRYTHTHAYTHTHHYTKISFVCLSVMEGQRKQFDLQLHAAISRPTKR